MKKMNRKILEDIVCEITDGALGRNVRNARNVGENALGLVKMKRCLYKKYLSG